MLTFRKKLLVSAFTVTGLIVLDGCNDSFLTRPPQGQYSPASLSNLKGIEGILIGAYGMIDGQGIGGQNAWENEVQNWVFGGIPSDDAYKGTDAGDQPEQSFIERYDFQPTNGHIRNKWRGLYEGVARCNNVLDILPQVKDITDARRKQIEAEAKFLRGYFHFEARKIFRYAPYIDEKIYDISDPNSTKIPNDKEIWPNIEADFNAAAAILPETQSQPGRPTKFAALAHLAKTYMFQGFDISSGAANTAKLQQAKAVLDQIVNSGKYKLIDNFSQNFDSDTRNNAESIFEVQYAKSASDDGAATAGMGLAHPYASPWGCCGFYQPSQNLVNAYKTDANGLPLLDTYNDVDVKNDQGIPLEGAYTPDAGRLDPRLDWTVGRRGILYKDFKIHNSDFIRDQTYAGPYSPKKHVASKKNTLLGVGWTNLTGNNFRLIRYAHVLLWLAECEVEIGSLERARALVNQVRARAANPNDWVKKAIQGSTRDAYTETSEPAANYVIKEYSAPWTDKVTARKAVRHETRLEFAMEGHRFFDLVRWGVAADVLNAYTATEGNKRTYLKGARFAKGKNEYFPIPQEAIDNSSIAGKPTLTQNPAYK
ncbi:RagB/SusD family nutrient uptake outer membrane protein [Spirosoma linguale]|uniref:RagB/SusD domain protein n=1 Tax=Spirosoma linguale (strain ATCC 33905 / DSM 74 / LMG 10896 / Claus 1) TaxID=504472 RepID=D2QBS6_SPILD|nr:RagB/SusD domain protein [Spirosoma linguale DSM 74]